MNLTFKGFLNSYCRELSGLQTSNLKKLCLAANTDAPRVAEPLFFYAFAQNKLNYLLELSHDTWMEEEYRALKNTLPKDATAEELAELGTLPSRYKNVLRSYQSTLTDIDVKRRVSSLMRKKTLSALADKGATCYRLCKDLNLNKGNVYAYLHKGDVTKVSLETAQRIMDYAIS